MRARVRRTSRSRGMVGCCCASHVLVPRLANPSLTDAPNALYTCLPNHALRWQRVSEAAPTSKWIRVYY